MTDRAAGSRYQSTRSPDSIVREISRLSIAPQSAFPPEGWSGLEAAPRFLPAAAWEELARAALRAVEQWPVEAHGYPDADAVRPSMRRICIALKQALEGERGAITEAEALHPLRPVLDALRREFLGSVRESSVTEPGEALRVLEAMESVQRMLDDTAAERFAARLSGTDALHLVVEVAHDMRSPLGSILFLAERLRSGQSGAVDSVQERQLGLIYSAAFGLSSMASDVMELARGGARLIGTQPIAFSLDEIFGSVRSILLPMAEEKQLELSFNGLEMDWRIGHPGALNRVILNLATNALKFTNEGRVEVSALPTSRTGVEFTITDTGRGIPDSVLASLFESFRRRTGDDSYAFSSAGLGLTICQKLIRAMGGELRVDTELEQGTRFSFQVELPAAPRM